MRRALVVALMSLALVPAAVSLAPSVAAACSCMRAPEPVEAARGVDVVFSAKLVSVEDKPGTGKAMGHKVFTFDVTETYKGQLDAQVRVMTAENSAACGRNYGDAGSEWLIYARTDQEGQLRDNLCSRSMPLADATADIEELVANADSLDQPPEPEQPGPGPADPEPEPIEPPADDGASEGDPDYEEGPDPLTPSKKGCAVTNDGFGGAGLFGLACLGLALGFRRRD